MNRKLTAKIRKMDKLTNALTVVLPTLSSRELSRVQQNFSKVFSLTF